MFDDPDLAILTDTDSEAERDEDKYADRVISGASKTIRVREDTAKYLLNLDADSAHYDAKTRSMRDAPTADFVGENFVRQTGEAQQVQEMAVFAWDATKKGVPLSLAADPTRAEMLRREYKQKDKEATKQVNASILAKYGGAEHFRRSGGSDDEQYL